MGLRRPLPQPSTPRRRPATLVALLQRAPTAQLARRPTPDQPRSQPPWAGHLGTAEPTCLNRRMGSGAGEATAAATAPVNGAVVRLEAVRKSFGDNLVLDGIDLTVATGEVLVV